MNPLVRREQRKISNNLLNKNKNLCGLAVAKHLNVHKKTKYLHTVEDLEEAIKKGKWGTVDISSRGYEQKEDKIALVPIGVHKLREQLSTIGFEYYMVHVKGHVILLDSKGETVVDTEEPVTLVDNRSALNIVGIAKIAQDDKHKDINYLTEWAILTGIWTGICLLFFSAIV